MILIVDDERFNCDIIKGFLSTLGLQDSNLRTLSVHDGQQAVTAVLEALD